MVRGKIVRFELLPPDHSFALKMATASVQTPHDWPGRYSHIDQILDRPGPRTIPEAFTGGDEVCLHASSLPLLTKYAYCFGTRFSFNKYT